MNRAHGTFESLVPLDSIIKSVFNAAGGLALIRLRNASRNRILTYHAFDPAFLPALELQCQHIRRHYNPVSLDAVARFVREASPVPRNSLAVTVDDGYRDFYDHAQPVFERYGIPVTVFIMTGFVDGDVKPWWDQLKYGFLHSPLSAADIRVQGGAATRFLLSDKSSRRNAADATADLLKVLSAAERLAFLDSLPGLLKVEMPVELPWRPMTWDEIRQLTSKGVSFGAHTKTHPILTSLTSEEAIRDEIEGSRDRLSVELGKPPAHFCYPNGRAADIDARTTRVAEAAGFQSAVSAIPGLNEPGGNLYMLKRLSVDPEMPLPYFSRRLAGFRL